MERTGPNSAVLDAESAACMQLSDTHDCGLAANVPVVVIS
jgi:hypothetical protein